MNDPQQKPATPNDLALEKLSAEVEKLRLEVADLRKPFYARPSILGAAFVATVGIGGQFFLSRKESVLAQIDKARAELDREKAEEEARLIGLEIDMQAARLVAMQEEERNLQGALQELTALVEKAKTAGQADRDLALEEVTSTATDQIDASKRRVERLGEISSQIQFPALNEKIPWKMLDRLERDPGGG